MTSEKEPHHFNTDCSYIKTPKLSRYEALFKKADNTYRAIGEASVWYLYSQTAVPNIEEYTNAKARYIVCLRNPVEMAYSLHEQQVFNGNEHIDDFAIAWTQQYERLQGRGDIRGCVDPGHLAYGEACKLGEQLERLYKHVPENRVLTVLLDDIKKDARNEYLRVVRFLGVDDDGRTVFPVLNAAKVRRSDSFRRMVHYLGKVKRHLGIWKGLGVLNAIDRYNTCQRSRQTLSDDMRVILQDYFREDVAKLSDLLSRDLTHWFDYS